MRYAIKIAPDRGTVWVNASDGSCIGRFAKKFGIDVHTTVSAQLDGAKECLFCTHAPAGEAEWIAFCDAMLKHHGVTLDRTLMTF